MAPERKPRRLVPGVRCHFQQPLAKRRLLFEAPPSFSASHSLSIHWIAASIPSKPRNMNNINFKSLFDFTTGRFINSLSLLIVDRDTVGPLTHRLLTDVSASSFDRGCASTKGIYGFYLRIVARQTGRRRAWRSRSKTMR